MIYECQQCSAALPAGSVACPQCGKAFLPSQSMQPQKEELQLLEKQVVVLTNRVRVLEMSAQQEKRRFTDHAKEVLHDLQRLQRRAS